jgi:hypothetical protein
LESPKSFISHLIKQKNEPSSQQKPNKADCLKWHLRRLGKITRKASTENVSAKIKHEKLRKIAVFLRFLDGLSDLMF